MASKRTLWHRIAVVLSALNLAGMGFAIGAGEPWHAAVHAGLALAFGVWALRLRQAPIGIDREARLEELEAEIGDLRRELSETQERLDFTERLLVQSRESRQA